MSEDITYCYNFKCKNMKCDRHGSNIQQHYIPHNFGFFKTCEHWDLPEMYFSTSVDMRGEQDAAN